MNKLAIRDNFKINFNADSSKRNLGNRNKAIFRANVSSLNCCHN